MIDDRLRGLERRFRLSGSFCDEVNYLTARRQQGDFEVNLRVAAAMGHPAARRVVGSRRIRLRPRSSAHTQIMTRACVAASRAAVSADSDSSPYAIRAQATVEQELIRPTSFTRADLLELSEGLFRETVLAYRNVAEAIYHCVFLVLEMEPPPLIALTGLVDSEDGQDALVAAARLIGVSATQAAVRSEVVPWLLEYFDPLEARVRGWGSRLPQADAEPIPPVEGFEELRWEVVG